MNSDSRNWAIGAFLVLVFWGMVVVGYVRNIVKFAKLDFERPYKAEVIRGAGIIGGFGSIIGWIKITDK